MSVATPVLVGMAEIQVLKGGGRFTCLGLGSCIGLAGLDPFNNVGGMVHVMLPEAFDPKDVEKPGKFADTGVPELLRQLEALGAVRSRMVWAMAGGAQVFRFSSESSSRMDIGGRNTTAVLAQAQRLGLRIVAKDVGGSLGRTVNFTMESGDVMVKTVSQGEKLLCRLRS